VVLVIAVLAFLLTRNLVRGRIGRAFAIVKENEAVALAMGVSPYRYKVLAFTIASLLGGVAGFMYLAIVQFTSPETLSFVTSINLVAAMIIGGSASIVGTVLGAIYFVAIPVFAGAVNSARTALISGAILLAVLFLLPRGLVSLPRRIRQLAAGSRRRGAPEAIAPSSPDGGAAAAGPGTQENPAAHEERQAR
jgi:branched-chain amino acid transport system permease protein